MDYLQNPFIKKALISTPLIHLSLAKQVTLIVLLLVIFLGYVIGQTYYPFLLLGMPCIYGYFRYRQYISHIRFIATTPLPSSIWQNTPFSTLNLTQQQELSRALQDFFVLMVLQPAHKLTMPSYYVGQLWQSLSQDDGYKTYAHGAFVGSTPLQPICTWQDKTAKTLTYYLSCQLQGVLPHNPHKLPRLFVIDCEIDGMTHTNSDQITTLYQNQQSLTANATIGGELPLLLDNCTDAYSGSCDGDGGGGDGGGGGGD